MAGFLREDLLNGVWSGTMPGGDRLGAELGVGRMTIEEALRILEKEGLLVGQGPRRRRRIVLPEDHAPPALRVAVLIGEKGDESHDFFIRFQNKLKAAGHTVVHAPKNLTEIGGDLRRLARLIKDTEADAWVVISGSKEVLRCFAQRGIPVFALYGWMGQLSIAGIAPNLVPSIVAATRRLVALRHRRIVMLEDSKPVSDTGRIPNLSPSSSGRSPHTDDLFLGESLLLYEFLFWQTP